MTNISEKDQIIIAYSFDKDDKRLIGSFEYFWAVGTGLAAQSTNVAPPAVDADFIPIFNELENTWSISEDHRRKTVYSTDTGKSSIVEYIGAIQDGYTLLKPNSIFETWTGENWADQRTAEDIEAERIKQFTPLTRYQFFRALLENGYKSADIEAQIQTIEDDFQRELVLLGWQSATNFVRTDESVLLMQNMLGWTDEQVEQMWTHAMTL